MEDRGVWSRVAARPVSRRRVLGASAAAAAAGAAYVAFGCNDRSAPEIRRGGKLRTGTTLPLAAGLDPHIQTGTGLAIVPRVYGYLLHVDPRDDSVIYDQAETVERPDETSYIFTLRGGVRFHDAAPVGGREITAADVAASIERYWTNPLVAARTWHETVLDGAEGTDAKTLRVTTKRPYVYSLAELGGISAGAIIPKELIEQRSDLTSNAIGSGPFGVGASSVDGVTKLKRHERYYREGLPYLDAMEWRVFANDEEKTAAFRRREIDVVIHRDVHEANAARDFASDVAVTSTPSLSSLSLGFRVDRPPFNDARVRESVDLALDRGALIRDLAAGEGDQLGPVNPHLADGYWSLPDGDVITAQAGMRTLDERRSSARQLLAAAATENVTVRLQVSNAPQLIDAATIVREQLRAIGMTVELDELDLIRWFANFRRGEFEMTLISHLPYETPDIPTRFFHSAGPFGTTSPFGFADGEIDRLVERSWGEDDREARRVTLLDAQRLMLAARPVLPLFTGRGYSSAWGYVRDRRAELPGSLPLYNYEVWLDGGPTLDAD